MKSLLGILKTTYKKRLPGEKETLAENTPVFSFSRSIFLKNFVTFYSELTHESANMALHKVLERPGKNIYRTNYLSQFLADQICGDF